MITLEDARFIVDVLEGRVREWPGTFVTPEMLSAREKIFLRFGEIYQSDTSKWSDEALRQARAEWLYRYLGGAE